MNVRVLLITGGHPYEREPFEMLWKSFPYVTLQEAQYPDAEAWFTPQRAGEIDVFAFYDFGQRMSATAQRNFVELTRRGKGFVFLHHALLGHADWPEYIRIVGGAWIDTPREIDGKTYPPSQYACDQQVSVAIAGEHAITRGQQDFMLHDETYQQLYIAQDNTPLLTTTHPRSDRMLAWTRRYERARVVYLQPGHGPTTYCDPNFRRILGRALQWAAGSDSPAD